MSARSKDEEDRLAFNAKVCEGTDEPAHWRSELARRIMGFRKVSRENDPARTYRAKANRCRKGELSYNRQFGIGKVAKPKRA